MWKYSISLNIMNYSVHSIVFFFRTRELRDYSLDDFIDGATEKVREET